MKIKRLLALFLSLFIVSVPFLAEAEESGGLTVAARDDGSWTENGRVLTKVCVSVKNTGAADVSGWKVSLRLPKGAAIVNSWNGIFELNDTILNVSPMDYNTYIPAKGEQTFGFVVRAGSAVDLSSAAGLSDVIIPSEEQNNVLAGDLNARIVKNCVWRTEGKEYTQLNVTVENNSSSSVSDWKFKLSVPPGAKTEQMWGGVFSQGRNEVIVTGTDYNKTICAGSTATFGLVVITDSNYTPESFSVGLNDAEDEETKGSFPSKENNWQPKVQTFNMPAEF